MNLIRAYIRECAICIRNRMAYLAGESPAIYFANAPEDGSVRWNNNKNTIERYDALYAEWVDIGLDYAGFPVP